MNRIVAIAFVGFAFLGTACGSLIGSESWFNSHSYGRQALATRASFDMSCPAGQLEYVRMGAGSDYTTVGVSGCQHRSVYTFVADRWILNSEGGASASR
jgi:hypothetical protein